MTVTDRVQQLMEDNPGTLVTSPRLSQVLEISQRTASARLSEMYREGRCERRRLLPVGRGRPTYAYGLGL